jgi:hypothetical protein
MTTTFFRDRGPSLALVILIMFAISLGQAGISYTMAFGALRALLPRDRSGVATSLVILRFGLVALMAVLWALRRKHALFQLIIIANALFTVALFVQTSSLISALFGGASEAINALLLDVALMATSNILIFSVWYWLIDPPGIEDVSRADEPWDFLFPQRGSLLPHPLRGLLVRCLHNELRVQPDRHFAAYPARQDANAAASRHIRRHPDGGGRQRDQYSRRSQMMPFVGASPIARFATAY